MKRSLFVVMCALFGTLNMVPSRNGQELTVASLPAVVVKTEPQAGLTDVDPEHHRDPRDLQQKDAQ